MAYATNDQKGDFDFWVDGIPYCDLKKVPTDQSSFAYFVDGLPFMPFVYPSPTTSVNKSSFMPFFWGVG